MKKVMYTAATLLVASFAISAMATPVIDSAVVNERVFNDCPGSTVTNTNLYPASLSIQDSNVFGAVGWANRHNFRLSDDGGISATNFQNGDAFAFSADVKLTGTANLEGGLNISPWWSPNVDGVFMLNGTSGEVAIFGGRLPFYSFTADQGITYVKGTTVRLGVMYQPNGLSAALPGVIRYVYEDGTNTYMSPHWLGFDMGNPTEDPPHGLWGLLSPFQVGGYLQVPLSTVDPANWGRVEYSNMSFVPEPASIALLGLALVALRSRR